jgi:hypothetical protein
MNLEHFKEYVKKESPNFTTLNKTVKSIFEDVRDGSMNLAPPHQRDIVHNNAWKSEVIMSVLSNLPLGSPEFHTVISDDEEILTSLDGKQRLSAIVNLLNDEYKMKCTKINDEKRPIEIPKDINGKYFKDWPKSWQSYLKGRQISILRTEKTLSREEIDHYFSLKQETKRTSPGEKLNSIASQAVEEMNDYISKSDVLKKHNVRNNKLKMVALMIYLSLKKNRPEPGAYKKPKDENLHLFVRDASRIEIRTQLDTYVDKTIQLIGKLTENPKRWQEAFYVPVLLLVIHVHNLKMNCADDETVDEKFKSFWQQKLNRGDGYFTNAARFSTDTRDRHEEIINDFSNFLKSP